MSIMSKTFSWMQLILGLLQQEAYHVGIKGRKLLHDPFILFASRLFGFLDSFVDSLMLGIHRPLFAGQVVSWEAGFLPKV